MIDLHNHLLPGIDDGAPDLDTALALAKIAVEDGITHMVCTPHIHPGRYENTKQSIASAFDTLQLALQQLNIELTLLSPGAEVRIGPEIMMGIERNEIPFIGHWHGKPVILLELPHSGIPLGSDKLTAWLIKHGIQPMIAHPERNKAIMQTPGKLKPFVEQGCLLQVTAGSMAGNFGERAQDLAVQLLRDGLITILASDAHNVQHRPPILSVAREVVIAEASLSEYEALVLHRPSEMIA
ncbi:tyrosine-protein phosphatase [Nitrincola nitratireducens]|uniref:protein-tyrosine-phosphatase n=1 Tax=Nitrincola nitratireducens TaxID=1229521 RepID=W9V3T1_9GAMM|nr:CpsB/CapC family capsule biosynthesis tyrosine phosphatase [Nitrincola nitratireducens]EXJ10787.1 Tyrosine-protein phosphatase YwqE [Nitrincola nitratireducens]